MCVRKTFNYRFYFFNSHMIIKVICYLLENKIKNYNGNNNMNKRICTNKIENLIEVENLRFRISSTFTWICLCILFSLYASNSFLLSL